MQAKSVMVTMETDSRAARPSPFPSVEQFLLVFMVSCWATGRAKEWWETVKGERWGHNT